MIYLGYNECYPKNTPDETIIQALPVVLDAYSTLKKLFPEDIDGVLTSKSADSLTLNQNELLLSRCIETLSYEQRRVAFRCFNKYDLETFIPITKEDAESILNAEPYYLCENDVRLDAINARIINLHGGILFSLPVNVTIQSDSLQFFSKEQPYFSNVNLFGAQPNIEFIKQYLENRTNQGLTLFEKLEILFGDNLQTKRFKKDFLSLSEEMQQIVLAHVQGAIDRKGKTKFFPDGDLIKDVSPEKAKYGVFEMRIFKPKALRIYFLEANNKVYLSGIENKPNPASQNNHIINAKDNIQELIDTQN